MVRVLMAIWRWRLCSSTLAFCLLTSQLVGQSFNAKSELTLGIAAFHEAKYHLAIKHLERVVTLEPQSASGHFHLAEAYDNAYSEECERNCAANGRMRERAREEFHRAFELDPAIIEALKAIAWHYDRNAKLDTADHYYRTALDIDPNDFEALYNLALLDWRRSYQSRLEKRAKLKLAQEKPLIHSPSCTQLRVENLARVQESIKLLERAAVMAESYDAQAYLGLLYRERADIQCGNQPGYDQDVNTALEWARRACDTRHHARVVTTSCTSSRCPSPAPAPPPSGEPGACSD